MPAEVRPFEQRDHDAVIALSLRAWAPVFAAVREILAPSGVYQRMHPDWRTTQRRAVAAVLEASEVPVWVAELDGSVAGFVAVTLHREEDLGEIYMIAVDPPAQRRGVGAALTAFATEWMRAQGMTVAMVQTGGDPGHAPARRSYERAGFTPLPSVQYFRAL